MTLTDDAQDAIDDIIDNFDFQKVEAMMAAVGWTWCDVGSPGVYDLRKLARRLLREVVRHPGTTTSTGGLLAESKVYSSCEHLYLSLQFVGAEWDNSHVFD